MATATTSAVPTLSAGTLTVLPKTVLLSPRYSADRLRSPPTADPRWSIITGPASLIGKLTVLPTSGTLNAGGSVTVTITATGLVTLDAHG